MAKPSDKEIAARAYRLWSKKATEGRDEEFWRMAEQELLNEINLHRCVRPTLCKND